ncbi:unnamed protein product, partial [Trichogramma brassicae]
IRATIDPRSTLCIAFTYGLLGTKSLQECRNMCNNLAQINEIAREKLVAAKRSSKKNYLTKRLMRSTLRWATAYGYYAARRREREREEELRRLEREREEARIQAQHTQSIESTESAEGERTAITKKATSSSYTYSTHVSTYSYEHVIK